MLYFFLVALVQAFAVSLVTKFWINLSFYYQYKKLWICCIVAIAIFSFSFVGTICPAKLFELFSCEDVYWKQSLEQPLDGCSSWVQGYKAVNGSTKDIQNINDNTESIIFSIKIETKKTIILKDFNKHKEGSVYFGDGVDKSIHIDKCDAKNNIIIKSSNTYTNLENQRPDDNYSTVHNIIATRNVPLGKGDDWEPFIILKGDDGSSKVDDPKLIFKKNGKDKNTYPKVDKRPFVYKYPNKTSAALDITAIISILWLWSIIKNLSSKLSSCQTNKILQKSEEETKNSMPKS